MLCTPGDIQAEDRGSRDGAEAGDDDKVDACNGGLNESREI